jgi:hypothetical protein
MDAGTACSIIWLRQNVGLTTEDWNALKKEIILA